MDGVYRFYLGSTAYASEVLAARFWRLARSPAVLTGSAPVLCILIACLRDRVCPCVYFLLP